MTERSAVLFLTDDSAKSGGQKPLFLQNASGAPLLRWLTEGLLELGIRRFFLAGAGRFREEAVRCVPKDAALTVAWDDDPADLLHVFLSTADEREEELLVVTGPTVLLPSRASADPGRRPVNAPACMAPRLGLMAALDEAPSVGSYLRSEGTRCTDREGFFPVTGPEALSGWGRLLNEANLAQLARNGVEIFDERSCYVAPGARVGIGTRLLPGTILEGETSVGYGCTIGPHTHLIDAAVGNHCTVDSSRGERCRIGNEASVGPCANLRPGTELGPRTKAGAFVELKNVRVGDGAQIAHLSYLGDATVGARVNVGCGTVTANFDRAEKHETQIGDDAFLGCNTTLVAPVTVGSGAYVGAGSVVTEDVAPNALGIARARQTNRRDWALTHKLEKEGKGS